MLSALAQPAQAQRIEWAVATPYPFFRDAADWNRLKPTTAEAGNFQTWTDRLFNDAAQEGTIWPESVATQWNASDERFDPGYLKDKIAITLRLKDAPSGFCQWSIAKTSVPCGNPVSGLVAPDVPVAISATLPSGETIPGLVHVQREIILGLGDSFSSGEGNPDTPVRFVKAGLRGKGGNWYKASIDTAGKAKWLDEHCHRSLYSYQNIAAMWLAAKSTHKAVYFIPLACSGAEIWDGVLERQKKPPGAKNAAGRNRLSQLHAAREVLECKKGDCLYKPNIIFISIGGNDVFFASLIKAALVPARGRNPITSALIPLLRNAYGLNTVLDDAYGKLVQRQELGTQIAYMLEQFDKTGLLAQKPELAVTGYPDLLRREGEGEKAALCSVACPSGTPYSGSNLNDPDTRCRSSINNALHHVQGVNLSKWEFRITGEYGDDKGLKPSMSEQNMLYEKVVHHLNPILHDSYTGIEASAGNIRLRWVDPPSAVSTHGVCAVAEKYTNTPRYELDWPWVEKNGDWRYGLSPAAWQPYQRRQRWFRTPNDTYLTQGNLSGAYHPSAEYHAAMASQVICALDGVPREQCK